MNKAILKGRMTKDATIRYTKDGKAVASFSIACDRMKDKNGNQQADFINCVAWEKIADTVSKYCGKGREILVEGRIQTRNYDASDGSKRYVTEVVVTHLEFCGKKSDAQGGGQQGNQQQNANSETYNQLTEDEIPF